MSCFQLPCLVGSIIPFPQLRALRPREGKLLSQGHPARGWGWEWCLAVNSRHFLLPMLDLSVLEGVKRHSLESQLDQITALSRPPRTEAVDRTFTIVSVHFVSLLGEDLGQE